MARYAIIEAGRVDGIAEASAQVAAQRGWVLAEAGTAPGDVDNGNGTFSRPAAGLAELKARLTQAATDKRWQVETGGLVLPGGVHVDTTTADQDRITSVLVNAGAAGVTSVDFKAASGWVTLTVDQVRGIASAIALHVQACFSAERAHHVAIDALATVAAAQAYDLGAGWPSNEEEPAA